MDGIREHHLKLVRLRRPKPPRSFSYVDYKPKTNAAIFWDMGHTKGGPLMGGIVQGKETKILNVVDVLSVQGINIEILNWLGPPWEGDYGGVKRTRRNELTGVVVHICMEKSQGNSLHSYLYLTLAKAPCISVYLLSFFFYKIRELADRTGPAGVGKVERGRWGMGGRGMHQWKGEVVGKGDRSMNVVEMLCIHVSK
jgi:hypothetical protein